MWSAGTPTPFPGLVAELRFDLELTILCVVLFALVVAGCVMVVRVRSWRDEETTPVSLEEQIQSYQTLVDRGELDPREFERIKARLEQKAAETPPPESQSRDR
jgi:hypothetical protein